MRGPCRNTYADLCRLLQLLPADAQTIADDLGLKRHSIYVWLRQLLAGGVITSTPKRGKNGSVMFHLMDGPKFERSGTEHVSRVNCTFIAAWDALVRRHTTLTLSTKIGVGHRQTCEIVRAMHDHGLIRVAGWELRVQNLTAIYDRIPGADAPRPPRKPREYVNSEHWARSRARAERRPEAAA